MLKIGYPPPKAVALRRFYGYATAIFEDLNYSSQMSPKKRLSPGFPAASLSTLASILALAWGSFSLLSQ
jgi:hypothetical protein